MKIESKAKAVERMKARALPLPKGDTFDRDKANARRVTIAEARAEAAEERSEGPSAARSGDFLHDEGGLRR